MDWVLFVFSSRQPTLWWPPSCSERTPGTGCLLSTSPGACYLSPRTRCSASPCPRGRCSLRAGASRGGAPSSSPTWCSPAGSWCSAPWSARRRGWRWSRESTARNKRWCWTVRSRSRSCWSSEGQTDMRTSTDLKVLSPGPRLSPVLTTDQIMTHRFKKCSDHQFHILYIYIYVYIKNKFPQRSTVDRSTRQLNNRRHFVHFCLSSASEEQLRWLKRDRDVWDVRKQQKVVCIYWFGFVHINKVFTHITFCP